MPDDKELQESKEEDSYVWDSKTKLYIHHSSGFYHDPSAGWYYCIKDRRYYKHENGEYIPLAYDESVVNPPVEIASCDAFEDESGPTVPSNDQEPEQPPRPSSWVEDALIELYLAGYNQQPNYSSYETDSGIDNQDNQMLSTNGEEDAEELEEGEWIPEEDFDPHITAEENYDEAALSREKEMWHAQYGQVIESPEKTTPEIPAVDLWDWKLVCESRKVEKEQVARLVGRLVKRSANLHPSVASGGTLFKTAPICEAQLHLVRVRTGQVYKLRNPSAKYLASLSAYDSSNPTKDWGFPDISTTWQIPDAKRKAKKIKRDTNSKSSVKLGDEVSMTEEVSRHVGRQVSATCRCFQRRQNEHKFLSLSPRQQRTCSYRDRAAERRNLHGGYGVGPGQKGTVSLNADEDSLPDVSEEEATAEALELSFGSGSYARKIMGNMGWKEGETLGKNTKGLLEPIQAASNIGNAGLGYVQRRRR